MNIHVAQVGHEVFDGSPVRATDMSGGLDNAGLEALSLGHWRAHRWPASVLGFGAGSAAGVSGTGGGFNGNGVEGTGAGGGLGVIGTGGSAGGTGVSGKAVSAGGVGVVAQNAAGGAGLQVIGSAIFSRSGILPITAGSSSATVTSAGLVLATLQQNLPGIWVRAAVPNVAGSSFTEYLNKSVSATTRVAWFVVN